MHISFDVRPDADARAQRRRDAETSVDALLTRARRWPRWSHYEPQMAARVAEIATREPTIPPLRLLWKAYRHVAALAKKEKTA